MCIGWTHYNYIIFLGLGVCNGDGTGHGLKLDWF
jgi:hypothetical protein